MPEDQASRAGSRHVHLIDAVRPRVVVPVHGVVTLRPGSAAPGARASSHTDSFTVSWIQSRSASVAVIGAPASLPSR